MDYIIHGRWVIELTGDDMQDDQQVRAMFARITRQARRRYCVRQLVRWLAMDGGSRVTHADQEAYRVLTTKTSPDILALFMRLSHTQGFSQASIHYDLVRKALDMDHSELAAMFAEVMMLRAFPEWAQDEEEA